MGNGVVEGELKDLDERRWKIIQGMLACITEKGFAGSSLTDIAIKAGMTPSHIRYYYDGKDAILADYLQRACTHLIEGINLIPDHDPEAWLDGFTSYFIGNPRMSPARLAIMVEIFGISVHDPALKRIKAAYDEQVRGFLVTYFQKVGCAPGLTPQSAAEIAQALEAGLKYNSVFQADFSPERFARLFRAEVKRLAGQTESA
jgi:AcrR family transcriptional regulator